MIVEAPAGETAAPVALPAVTVAVCGLGGMGSGLAVRLASLGCAPIVWNRTAAKQAVARAAGGDAGTAAAPAAPAAAAGVVLLMLTDDAAVRSVVSGPDGVLAGAAPGTVLVAFSTTSAAFSAELADEAARHGVDVVDGCVIGNPLHARTGGIRLLVGGASETLDRIAPVLAL